MENGISIRLSVDFSEECWDASGNGVFPKCWEKIIIINNSLSGKTLLQKWF